MSTERPHTSAWPLSSLGKNPLSHAAFFFPEMIQGESWIKGTVEDIARVGTHDFEACLYLLGEQHRMRTKANRRDLEVKQQELAQFLGLVKDVENRPESERLAHGLVWKMRQEVRAGNFKGDEWVKPLMDLVESDSFDEPLEALRKAASLFQREVATEVRKLDLEENYKVPAVGASLLWAQTQWLRQGRPVYVVEREVADAMHNSTPHQNTLTELPRLPHPGMYLHIEGGLDIFRRWGDDSGLRPGEAGWFRNQILQGLYLTYDDPSDPQAILITAIGVSNRDGDEGEPTVMWPVNPSKKVVAEQMADLSDLVLPQITQGFTFHDPLSEMTLEEDHDKAAYWWVREMALLTVNLLTCLNRTKAIKSRSRGRGINRKVKKNAKRKGYAPTDSYTLLYIDPSARATIKREYDGRVASTRKGSHQVRHLRPGHFTHVWVLEPKEGDLPDHTKVSEKTGKVLYRVVRYIAPHWAGQETDSKFPPRRPARRLRKW